MPRTILFIHPSDELYGSDRVLLNIITGLDRAQYTPIVVLAGDLQYEGKLSTVLRAADVKVVSVKMGVIRRKYFHPLRIFLFLYYTLLGLWHISRLVQQYKVDIIYSNTSAVVSGGMVAPVFRRRHYWHVHEIHSTSSVVGRLIYQYIGLTATEVIVISEAVAAPLRVYVKPEKVQIIWNGIDVEKFAPRTTNSPRYPFWEAMHADDIIVGVVGRISHWKGQKVFVEAASIALQNNPRLKFVIVGGVVTGDEQRLEDLKNYISTADIDDHVRILDFTDNIVEIMQGLDIFVLPSTSPEPFGMVVVEAMACGCVVIASAHGGPIEIIEDGVSGVLVPPQNADALAMEILQLAQNAEKCMEIGQAARNRVVQHFSVARFQQKINERLEH